MKTVPLLWRCFFLFIVNYSIIGKLLPIMRCCIFVSFYLIMNICYSQNAVIKAVECDNTYTGDSLVLKEMFDSAYKESTMSTLIMDKCNGGFAVRDDKYIIPDEIKEAALCALVYYPELSEYRLVFKYRNIIGTVNARPDVMNLFRKRTNRKFILLINNNKGEERGLSMLQIPFNAKVGWFGHEFAHVYTYHLMNNLQSLIFSIRYISSGKYAKKVERYTDLIAIQRGFLFQLYEGDNYLRNNTEITKKYKKRTLYNALTLKEYMCLWYHYRFDNPIQ